jgi:Leucine-rich repeat (LRR) protein
MVTVGTNFNQRSSTISYWQVGSSISRWLPENLEYIKQLELKGTAIKEVPSSIQFLTRLRQLDMSGCSKLESFPEITVPMKSLRYLYLSKTGIKALPLSIKDMVCLEVLNLHGTPIKALPELPSSLCYLTTHDCASLETVTSIINIGRLWFRMNFSNCFKLDQKSLVAAMHLKIQVSLITPLSFFLLSFLLASSHFRNVTFVLQSGEEITDGIIKMVLPGSEIPEWFGDKGIGSSLTIQLPSNCHQLKGIASLP